MQGFRSRFFLSYFGIGLIAFLAVYFFLSLMESFVPGNNLWVKARIRGQLKSISESMTESPPLILFVGASEVEVSFDPVALDNLNSMEGRPTQSYNMGVRNNGTFLPLYFERIAEELKAAGIRPRILFVHFPISRLTTTALEHYGEMMRTDDLPAVYFRPSLWGKIPGTAGQKFHMLVNKWIWGERSLMMVPALFNREARNLITPPEEGFLKSLDLFNQAYTSDLQAWNENLRGRFYLATEEADPQVQAAKEYLNHPKTRKSMVSLHELCCSFRDLPIDPAYAQEVLSSLKRLSLLADHTVIVDLPEFSGFKRTPEAEDRRRAFFSTAAKETGGNLWEIAMAPSMYVDLLHLGPTGTKRFVRRLSELIPPEWLTGVN